MALPAVTVDGLGKQYTLGLTTQADRFSEVLVGLARRIAGREASGSSSGQDRLWALRDVSFEIPHGAVMGIIGRNGAGKSTLLKILSRITLPTEGRAELRGRVGSLLEVGTGFHPELTGRENVFLSGAILGMGRTDIVRAFDAIVDFAEIERFIDTPVKRYSSGMYTRLAFAVAAHLNPEILIVDEVLAVGDVAFQKKCLARMEQDARGGRTILFVSHNMTAIQSLCDEVLLIEGGRLTHRGTPRSAVERYLGASGDVLHRSWCDVDPRPGDPVLALESLELVEPGGTPLTEVDRGAPFRIRIRVTNRTPDLSFNVSLHVMHGSGACAFNTYSEVVTLPPGPHVASCEIPARLLNDGVYSLRLLLVRDAAPFLIEDDALTFEVRDSTPRTGWYGDLPGVVRPDLPWTIEAGDPE